MFFVLREMMSHGSPFRQDTFPLFPFCAQSRFLLLIRGKLCPLYRNDPISSLLLPLSSAASFAEAASANYWLRPTTEMPDIFLKKMIGHCCEILCLLLWMNLAYRHLFNRTFCQILYTLWQPCATSKLARHRVYFFSLLLCPNHRVFP